MFFDDRLASTPPKEISSASVRAYGISRRTRAARSTASTVGAAVLSNGGPKDTSRIALRIAGTVRAGLAAMGHRHRATNTSDDLTTQPIHGLPEELEVEEPAQPRSLVLDLRQLRTDGS